MQLIDNIPVWGVPDQGALSQIKTCAKTADRILHTLTPVGVAMAGASEFDPYKD